MRDSEQRVFAMVEKYIPDAPDADKVQMAAFLACECWNLINESVHDLKKEYEWVFKKARWNPWSLTQFLIKIVWWA